MTDDDINKIEAMATELRDEWTGSHERFTDAVRGLSAASTIALDRYLAGMRDSHPEAKIVGMADMAMRLIAALRVARARVLELEAPGECQSLHKLRAEVQLQSDRAEQAEILAAHEAAGARAADAAVVRLEAERDELAAEVRRLHEEARRGRLIMGDLCDMGSIKAVDWCSDGRAAEAAARSRGWM